MNSAQGGPPERGRLADAGGAPTTAEHLVVADGLVRQFPNGAFGLRGVSLTVSRGEWVTVTGRSGAGKSTLLAILGALDRPTAGSITVDGHDLLTLDDRTAARYRGRTVGFVFQHYYLVPYLTVLENVALAGQLGGGAGEEAAAEVLHEVGLSHRLRHLPRELSGGEQQRACIARAAVNRPQLLLADEPTANLDLANRQAVFELLGDLHAAGRTVVLVSHDPPELPWPHRVVALEDGRIVEERAAGSPSGSGPVGAPFKKA